MNHNPLVYVLILNWNGKELTIECVNSVLESDYKNFKILVIDNGSTDGSVEAFEKNFGNKIEIIKHKKNLGYSGGFNSGLKYAFEDKSADFCLVMNNDTIIDKKAISELVKIAINDEKIGFVTGKVYYYDNPKILQTVGKKSDPILWNGDHIGNKEPDNGQYDFIRELPFADDIFTLVRKELYFDTGGYDTTFFLQSEEYDWQARAKKKGYKIYYTPYAKLWHKESMTLGKNSPLKAFYNSRNPLLVILKHREKKFFKQYFWRFFIKSILKESIKEIIFKHDIKIAISRWKGFFSAINWGIKEKKFTIGHFI